MGRRTGAFSALQNAPSDMSQTITRRSGAFTHAISAESSERRPSDSADVYFHRVSADEMKALLEELRGICRSAEFQASVKRLREHSCGALLKREGMAKLLGMFWKAPLKARGFSIDVHGFPRMMAVVREHWDAPGVRVTAREVERHLGVPAGALFHRPVKNGSSSEIGLISSVYVEAVEGDASALLGGRGSGREGGLLSDAESEVIDCSESDDGMDAKAISALKTEDEVAQARCWEIVGGTKTGGVLVREEERINSLQYTDRLSTGSLVEEIELRKDRLHYKLVEGRGPPRGWVTTHLRDGREIARRICTARATQDINDRPCVESNGFASSGDAEDHRPIPASSNGIVDSQHLIIASDSTSEVNGRSCNDAEMLSKGRCNRSRSESSEFIPTHAEDPLQSLQQNRSHGERASVVERASLQVSFAREASGESAGPENGGLSDSSEEDEEEEEAAKSSASGSPCSRHSGRLGSSFSAESSRQFLEERQSQQPSRRHSVVSFADEVDYITDYVDYIEDGTSTENLSSFSTRRNSTSDGSFGGWDLSEVFSYGRERRVSVVSIGAASDNWEIGEVGSPVGSESPMDDWRQTMSGKRSHRRGKSLGCLKKSSMISPNGGVDADRLNSSLKNLQASRDAQTNVVQKLMRSKLGLLTVGAAFLLGALVLHRRRRP